MADLPYPVWGTGYGGAVWQHSLVRSFSLGFACIKKGVTNYPILFHILDCSSLSSARRSPNACIEVISWVWLTMWHPWQTLLNT